MPKDAQNPLATPDFEALKAQAAKPQFGEGPINKAELLDTPFVITGAEWKTGQGDGQYVTLDIVLGDNSKRTVSDGSTGIREEIKEYEAGGGTYPLFVGGLRKSEYTNQFGENTTYYLKS
jgi:hypothetical protein